MENIYIPAGFLFPFILSAHISVDIEIFDPFLLGCRRRYAEYLEHLVDQ